MATPFSLSNFISFISPLKPHSKAPPESIPILSSVLSQKNTNGRMSMAADDSLLASSSSSSNELASVICPSLAYSNTLFFKSAYNVQVNVDDNEPEERLVNWFKRDVTKAGVIQECKRRRFFENKQGEENDEDSRSF